MLQIYGFLSVEQKNSGKKRHFLSVPLAYPLSRLPTRASLPATKMPWRQIPPKGDVARSSPTPTCRGQRQQKTVIRATEYSGLYLRTYGWGVLQSKRSYSIMRRCETEKGTAQSRCFAPVPRYRWWYSRRESNPDLKFRKLPFYPLNYKSRSVSNDKGRIFASLVQMPPLKDRVCF